MSTGWGDPNNTTQPLDLEARIRELEDQNHQLAKQLEAQKQHIQSILQQALNDLSSTGRRDSKYNNNNNSSSSSSGRDRSRHHRYHRHHDPLPDQGNVFEEFKKSHPGKQPYRKRGRGGRGRRDEYGSPSPEGRGNPGRRLSRPYHRQESRTADLNDPAGWDMGGTNNADGWDIVAPSKAAEQTHPVMPGSVARMTGSRSEIPSSVDKVNQWQESGTVASSENIPRAPEEEGMAIEDDDDDDDSDDRMQLFSKRRRSEMSVGALEDSEGSLVTLERMAPLWRIFAWIPLDDLPIHYKTQYGVDLCDRGSRKKARMAIKNMPGLSERLSVDDKNKQQVLLFKDKGHLKQAAAYQRLFVKSPVLEPVLFLFLVTTVRQPLALQQAGTVEKLWRDEFGKTPVGVTTAKHSSGEGQVQWKTIESVWQAALQWLKDLASTTATHGPKYLANKLTAWADGGVEDSSRWKLSDPDSLLVAGLTRDELNALLRASPHLLKDIMQGDEIRRLRNELDFD